MICKYGYYGYSWLLMVGYCLLLLIWLCLLVAVLVLSCFPMFHRSSHVHHNHVGEKSSWPQKRLLSKSYFLGQWHAPCECKLTGAHRQTSWLDRWGPTCLTQGGTENFVEKTGADTGTAHLSRCKNMFVPVCFRPPIDPPAISVDRGERQPARDPISHPWVNHIARNGGRMGLRVFQYLVASNMFDFQPCLGMTSTYMTNWGPDSSPTSNDCSRSSRIQRPAPSIKSSHDARRFSG